MVLCRGWWWWRWTDGAGLIGTISKVYEDVFRRRAVCNLALSADSACLHVPNELLHGRTMVYGAVVVCAVESVNQETHLAPDTHSYFL